MRTSWDDYYGRTIMADMAGTETQSHHLDTRSTKPFLANYGTKNAPCSVTSSSNTNMLVSGPSCETIQTITNESENDSTTTSAHL